MQKVKCIAKKKDKNGIITQYQVQDTNGKVTTVTPQQLKEAIKNNKVECINLTLTSDNRLINRGKDTKDVSAITDKCISYGTTFKLDKLVDSDDWEDRLEAAKQGYGLDKLVCDKEEEVRKEVAKQGYGFKKLIDDKYREVRKVIAEQGYGLDKLICDKSDSVRDAVDDYLLDNKYESIFEWASKNVNKRATSEKMDFKKWLNSDDWCKRWAVARGGYGLDKLILDENPNVRYGVLDYLVETYISLFNWAKECPNRKVTTDKMDIDEWATSDNVYKRIYADWEGYGLDRLVKDKDKRVREEVARRNEEVYLDKLVEDNEWEVRLAVAQEGYGLNQLIKDTNSEVREAVKDYLKRWGYESISDWCSKNSDRFYYI